MIRIKVLAISASVLFGAAPLAGQDSLRVARDSMTISFADAIRIALAQNNTLRTARNTAALDAVAVRQQRLQFLPDLRATTQGSQQYGRSFNETEGQIVDRSTQTLNGGLSSSVTLFNGFGNVASLREAQLEQGASELDLTRARQTVVFTVASNYLALIQQQEQLRIRREALTAQEALEHEIQEYVDAGSRPIADLYQQQASVASARLAVVEAQRNAQLAEVDLIQTLQLDPSGRYAFAAPSVGATPAVDARFDLDSLLAQALVRRVDISAEESRASAAEQGIRAARASYWPTVSLTGGYNTAYTTASDFSFADQLNQRRGGSIGIGLSIPLFDRGNAQLATQRAQIQEENARIALANQRQEVGLQVRRAFLDFTSAQAQLTAAEAQQRAAELALQTTMERYQVGAATLIEITQARATQVQAASTLVSARYSLLFQRTLMQYYVGDLDPEQLTLG